jgi:hypothetical protein
MTCEIENSYGWSYKHESDGNRLKGIQNYKLSISSPEADIWFKVAAQRATAGTEVRGRIVGPRCLFEPSVQAVSPLRSVKHVDDGQAEVIVRTSFPHPYFWNPRNPFLYRVVVELWQDEQLCDVSGFDLGFRTTVIGLSGVSVNEEPFLLQGMANLPDSLENAIGPRQAGYNLVLADKGQWNLWVRANPMGFLLLERVTLSRLTPHYIALLYQQPCFLGFVLDKEIFGLPQIESEKFLRAWQDLHVYIGLELDGPPPSSLPNGLSFLVCPESILPSLSSVSLPKISLLESEDGKLGQPTDLNQGMLGWINRNQNCR